ncbi:MAG TPA: MetQ/NlpA family ABC transporter substrate-binding protein [Spirochaetales bacterium]|nr:MetQ/NlpA family ABC transporter substrate-binding protein [Spirochaetales bacterium]HRY55509.1 MetQ/NlpA family ABC transporter substrate-binding protein [Spirochaetia bacterium]HRZ66078.1 MetQ/NlpA family ABC transporter substrate-binding protein [Spirochaetia bacterium]
MRKTLRTIAALALAALAAASLAAQAKKALDPKRLVVGVTAGLHEEIMEEVKKLAAAEGLVVEIKVFSDYVLPNLALAEGDIDLNSFQHKPYLDKFKADRKLDLVPVANTITAPLGIYSRKLKSLGELKDGARLGLPNDPSNGSRSLLLFQTLGLIELDKSKGLAVTVRDITKNPKKLRFMELEASQLPRQLEELDAAAINVNFAVEAGFVPARDSIGLEPPDSYYVNIIAARAENKDDPTIARLVKLYRSAPVKAFVESRFKGSTIVSW